MPGRSLVCLIRGPFLLTCVCATLAAPTAWGQFTEATARTPARSAERKEVFAALAQEAAVFERQGRLLKQLIELVRPSVVHIEAHKRESRYQPVEETGSGVILSQSGRTFVLTNLHVIRDVASSADIDVRLDDGRKLHPSQVVSDPGTDIAVLEIQANDLTPARLGNSDLVEVGDFVLAYGSPFGLSHSATFGIISAKGRRDLDLDDGGVIIQNFLQTDAAINPGNSGGPLVNVRGEVVGLNTAIASSSGGNEGIGFSIPINMATHVARELVSKGKVVYAYLGVTLDSTYSSGEANQHRVDKVKGALVKDIVPRSPADSAKIAAGDVIIRFNGMDVEDDTHLVNLVKLTPVGEAVPVEVFRGGKRVQLKVAVANRSSFETE